MVKLEEVGESLIKLGGFYTIIGAAAFILFAIASIQWVALFGLGVSIAGMIAMSIGIVVDTVAMSKQKVGSIQPHPPEHYK